SIHRHRWGCQPFLTGESDSSFVRGHLCAQCPLTNPQSAPHTTVCLHCYGYIRSTAGAQRASSPALTTMSCSVVCGRLPYHAPASQCAGRPCPAAVCFQ
ncbi:MAG TPA: hypothetical protein PLU42_11950, partial [Spirochaetota bacterium]|nr:hypothetical protein [Spirochaetota bacterium]